MLICVLNTGCGTIVNHTTRTTREFGGIKYDIYVIDDCVNINHWKYCDTEERIKRGFWFCFYLIDLPISIMGDTLVFPVDYFYWVGKPSLFSSEPTEPLSINVL